MTKKPRRQRKTVERKDFSLAILFKLRECDPIHRYALNVCVCCALTFLNFARIENGWKLCAVDVAMARIHVASSLYLFSSNKRSIQNCEKVRKTKQITKFWVFSQRALGRRTICSVIHPSTSVRFVPKYSVCKWCWMALGLGANRIQNWLRLIIISPAFSARRGTPPSGCNNFLLIIYLSSETTSARASTE